MPIVNRIAEFGPDMAAWRQHIHAHPELSLACHDTAAFVVGVVLGSPSFQRQ